MKTITIKISVPDWAKWVAVDSYGILMAFECEPSIGMNPTNGYGWYSRYSQKSQKDILQFNGQKYAGWRKSKRKVIGRKAGKGK